MKALTSLAAVLLLAACATSGSPPGESDDVLHPKISETESSQWQAEASTVIHRASSALANVAAANLSKQDRSRLNLARDLLSRAREAHSDGDFQQSAELANKAAVIAEDLSER